MVRKSSRHRRDRIRTIPLLFVVSGARKNTEVVANRGMATYVGSMNRDQGNFHPLVGIDLLLLPPLR
jgi:hypothetical protein